MYTGLIFGITLHIKDKDLLAGLVSYFKSFIKVNESTVKKNSIRTNRGLYFTDSTASLKFSSFFDIENIIIPFFSK